MMNKYSLLVFFTLSLTFSSKGQRVVTISPQYPMRGDSLTVIYHPTTDKTKTDTIPFLEFTYSNFYELPQKMEMQPLGTNWKISFKLPPYAVFSTFIIRDGAKTIKPSDSSHYEITVYDKKKDRVKNSYLYQAYSLSAQGGRTLTRKEEQAALIKEELKHFPDNYEAKLRLLNYQISQAREAEKPMLYKKANNVIAGMFYKDPGKMAYTNLTTMGYLIMGEKTRLDSLREIIKEKYPTSEAGYELRISDLTALDDSARMIKELKDLLKNENKNNRTYLTTAHEVLFQYYAQKKNREATLHHLSYLHDTFTPYTPSELKNQAEVLYKNSVALDTALALAKKAMAYADTFPISLIRYFPETGYLPAYVTRKQREESVKNVTAQLKSLMALILYSQGKDSQAKGLMAEALRISDDNETLKNAGKYYSEKNRFDEAFNAYKMASYNDPEDTTSYNLMELNYKKWKGSLIGLQKYKHEIEAHWIDEMNKELKKEIISEPLPDVLSNYVDLKGNPLKADLIANKIVVMDFWATWCVPCMHSMPYMEEVYQKYKNDSNVVFMIVNSGSKNELSDAQNWWGNKKYSFPVYYNKDKAIGDKMGFNLIPATFIIDKQGKIRFKTLGFEGKKLTRTLSAKIELLKNKISPAGIP